MHFLPDIKMIIIIKDSHNLTAVGPGRVSTLTFHGPAFEGGDHLLSIAAFPSTQYTHLNAFSVQKG